jgi:hypothetical protein
VSLVQAFLSSQFFGVKTHPDPVLLISISISQFLNLPYINSACIRVITSNVNMLTANVVNARINSTSVAVITDRRILDVRTTSRGRTAIYCARVGVTTCEISVDTALERIACIISAGIAVIAGNWYIRAPLM